MHQEIGVQPRGGQERLAVESDPTVCENHLFPPAESQLLEVPAGTSLSVADTITRVLFLNQTAQRWLWEKLSMTPTQWGHIGEQTVKTQWALMACLECCCKGAAVMFCTSMQCALWLWRVCIRRALLAVLLSETFKSYICSNTFLRNLNNYSDKVFWTNPNQSSACHLNKCNLYICNSFKDVGFVLFS